MTSATHEHSLTCARRWHSPSLSAPAFIMSDEIRLYLSTATLIRRRPIGALFGHFSRVSGAP